MKLAERRKVFIENYPAELQVLAGEFWQARERTKLLVGEKHRLIGQRSDGTALASAVREAESAKVTCLELGVRLKAAMMRTLGESVEEENM